MNANIAAVLAEMKSILNEVEVRGLDACDRERLEAFRDVLLEFAGDLIEAFHADGKEIPADHFDELMACIEVVQQRIFFLGATDSRSASRPVALDVA